MTIWAIVPVKPLRRGKSRLAEVLSEDERTRLNRMFLERTLQVLGATPGIGQKLVVSRDPAALAIAREFNARTLLEDGAQLLNLALERATAVAQAYGARGVLILPADIPLSTREDIQLVLQAARRHPSITIVPDRREDGTNALLVVPPGRFKYQYGPGSFHIHCQLARQSGMHVEVLRSPNLELDLDTPEDLDLFRELTRPESTPE